MAKVTRPDHPVRRWGRLRTLVATTWPAGRAVQVLVATSFVRSLASGTLVTISTLYFLEVTGLRPAEIGFALTCAAVASVVVGYPAGLLADAVGARRLCIVSRLACGISIALYLVVDDLGTLIVAAGLYALLNTIGGVASAGLVATALEPGDRTRGRAAMRVVSNIGVGLGAAAAGVVLQVNRVEAFHLALVPCAVVSGASALIYLALPDRPAPVRPPAEQPARAVTDWPYLGVTALAAVLATNDALLFVGLPIWISTRTAAPVETFSVAVLVNAVGVIVLQFRVARWATGVRACARVLRLSGLALALACLVWGLSGQVGTVPAVGLVVLGAVLHLLGELLLSAGSWGLSYDLAPAWASGQYQGVFNTGTQLAGVLTPVVAGGVLVSRGLPAWLLFGAVLVAAGSAVPAATAWALRSRPDPSVGDEADGTQDAA